MDKFCYKHNADVLPGSDCEQCVYEEEFTTCLKHGIAVEFFVDCPQCMEEEWMSEL